MWPHYLGDICLSVVQWVLSMIESCIFGLILSMLTFLGWMLLHVGIWLNMFDFSCGMHCWSYVMGYCQFVDYCFIFLILLFIVQLFCTLFLIKCFFRLLWFAYLRMWRLTCILNQTYFWWRLVSCALVLLGYFPHFQFQGVATMTIYIPWLI